MSIILLIKDFFGWPLDRPKGRPLVESDGKFWVPGDCLHLLAALLVFLVILLLMASLGLQEWTEVKYRGAFAVDNTPPFVVFNARLLIGTNSLCISKDTFGGHFEFLETGCFYGGDLPCPFSDWSKASMFPASLALGIIAILTGAAAIVIFCVSIKSEFGPVRRTVLYVIIGVMGATALCALIAAIGGAFEPSATKCDVINDLIPPTAPVAPPRPPPVPAPPPLAPYEPFAPGAPRPPHIPGPPVPVAPAPRVPVRVPVPGDPPVATWTPTLTVSPTSTPTDTPLPPGVLVEAVPAQPLVHLGPPLPPSFTRRLDIPLPPDALRSLPMYILSEALAKAASGSVRPIPPAVPPEDEVPFRVLEPLATPAERVSAAAKLFIAQPLYPLVRTPSTHVKTAYCESAGVASALAALLSKGYLADAERPIVPDGGRLFNVIESGGVARGVGTRSPVCDVSLGVSWKLAISAAIIALVVLVGIIVLTFVAPAHLWAYGVKAPFESQLVKPLELWIPPYEIRAPPTLIHVYDKP